MHSLVFLDELVVSKSWIYRKWVFDSMVTYSKDLLRLVIREIGHGHPAIGGDRRSGLDRGHLGGQRWVQICRIHESRGAPQLSIFETLESGALVVAVNE